MLNLRFHLAASWVVMLCISTCAGGKPEKSGAPAEAISHLKSSDAASRRRGLLKIIQAGRRQTDGSAWAAPYLEAGVIEALVVATAQPQQQEVREQVRQPGTHQFVAVHYSKANPLLRHVAGGNL